jgi:hypothetical protein
VYRDSMGRGRVERDSVVATNFPFSTDYDRDLAMSDLVSIASDAKKPRANANSFVPGGDTR